MNTPEIFNSPSDANIRSAIIHHRLSWTQVSQYFVSIIFLIIPFQIYINIGPAVIAIGYLFILLAWMTFSPTLIHRNWKLVNSKLLLPILFLWLAIIITLPRIVYWNDFLIKISHLGIQIFFYIFIINLIGSEDQIRKIIKCILIAGGLSAFLGVFLYILVNVFQLISIADLMAHRLSPILYGGRAAEFFRVGYYSWVRLIPGQAREDFRSIALFVTPGENGLFSLIIFFLVLGLRKSLFKKRQSAWIILILISLLNIFFAQTRGVWLGLLLGMLVYSLRQKLFLRPSRLIFLSLGIVLALTLAISAIGLNSMIVQIQSIVNQFDSSSFSRMTTMRQGIDMIKSQTLLIGIGPGNEKTVFEQSGLDWMFGATTHSMYLDTAIAIGGIGLVIFFWILLRSWKEARQVRRISDSLFLHGLASGFQYALLAIMVTFIFQGNLFGNPKTNLLIWGLIGLISSAARISKNEITIS